MVWSTTATVINDYISRELVRDPALLPLADETSLLETGILDSVSLLRQSWPVCRLDVLGQAATTPSRSESPAPSRPLRVARSESPAPRPSGGSELAGESRQRGSNCRKHRRPYLHYPHFY